MKKELRIVFMGTPDFAVGILDHIVKSEYNVVATITAPDKPAGRGRKINQSAVKKYSSENSLKVLQPTNLKDATFLTELESLNANLFVVVAFRMLPKVVWNMPKFGTFNLHASLLPKYRGAAPINWAIINGEKKTGVTTFFLDEKIDTGEIILQEEVAIEDNDNAGDLHDKLMNLGSEVVLNTIRCIQSDHCSTTKQQNSQSSEAPKLFKENCKINWALSPDQIRNKIRGLSPYPSAWSYFLNEELQSDVKIYDVEFIPSDHQYDVGDIVTTKSEIKVAIANGFMKINDLKIAGKRKMDAKSLLNGFTFSDGAKMV